MRPPRTLRLEFSSTDLGRVRISSTPHPMWELVLGINTLQSPHAPSQYDGWRSRVLRDGKENKRLLTAATTLVPISGSFPDFLTPDLATPDVEAHLEAVLSTPRQQLQADLERMWRRQAPPSWAKGLYRYERLDGVVEMLRRCHQLLVEPVGALQVETDRARFARHLVDGGTERLLANLHPSIRWRSPALEADYPIDRTISLQGRGLVIIPARFCWGAPVTFVDAERPPTLIVPASGACPAVDTAVNRLGRLLGPTRARVLGELAVGGSTTELATRLNISLAAASEHAKVLREARLVATTRSGKSVRHVLTPMGRLLLGC